MTAAPSMRPTDRHRSAPLHLYRVGALGTVDCDSAFGPTGDASPTSGDVTGDGIADLVVRDGSGLQIWSIDPAAQ